MDVQEDRICSVEKDGFDQTLFSRYAGGNICEKPIKGEFDEEQRV